MAKELTAEQRARKNERARLARAAKAQAVAPVVETDSERQAAVTAAGQRAFILTAKEGTSVTAPRGGIPGYVNKTFRLGGRFVTEDGEGVYPTFCGHSPEDQASKGTRVYFEQVGDGNKDWTDGAHGFAHRFSRCNKVVQVG